jgi:hypothetical protein
MTDGFVAIEQDGYCCLCDKQVLFKADGPYLRSTLRCPVCDLGPRHRHIFWQLNKFFPKWRDLEVHESSPGHDLVSKRLAHEGRHYTATQWDPSVPFGTTHPKGYRSEDLQSQTFPDETFDLVITQDIFEHIFHPDRAIKEIARTLKPNGAFIATVPIILRPWETSRRRASLVDGDIVHHLPAEYHGNPVSKDGSLVTIDWSPDICGYLQHHSGLSFLMLRTEDYSLGIGGLHTEVLIGFKRQIPLL